MPDKILIQVLLTAAIIVAGTTIAVIATNEEDDTRETAEAIRRMYPDRSSPPALNSTSIKVFCFLVILICLYFLLSFADQ